MAVTKTRVAQTLRFEIGVDDLNGRTGGGVVVFDKIPAGAVVQVDVDQPDKVFGAIVSEIEKSDGGAGVGASGAQAYAFEHAPYPGPYTVGGVAVVASAARYLIQSGNGVMTPVQVIPAWSAFSSPVTGAVVQKGKLKHTITMPGWASDTPNLNPNARNLLRFRWTGTAVTGESLGTPDGSKKAFSGTLANGNVAPGSVVATATVGGKTVTIRDDGNGRLCGMDTTTVNGASADGYIEYQSGVWSVTFTAAPDNSTTFRANYEKNCTYRPLDVCVEYDVDIQ